MKDEVSALESSVASYESCQTSESQSTEIFELGEAIDTLVSLLQNSHQELWRNVLADSSLDCSYVPYEYCNNGLSMSDGRLCIRNSLDGTCEIFGSR